MANSVAAAKSAISTPRVGLQCREADRQCLGVLAGQNEGEQKLVPAEDEAQETGRENAGGGDRHGDADEGLEARGAFDPCGLFQLLCLAFEKRDQHPGEEREVDGEMGDDQGDMGVQEPGRQEPGEERKDENHRR